MRFELFLSKNRKLAFFRLIAANGQNLVTSVGFDTKGEAKAALTDMGDNAGDERRYVEKKASDGRHFFEVLDGAGELVARSQMYASASGMRNGIKATREVAPVATLKDLARPVVTAPDPERLIGNLDQGSIPPEVVREYSKSLQALMEHVELRADTAPGAAFKGFSEDLDAFVRSFDAPPGDDEGFDCLGSIGTFGSYGGCLGSAGTFGSADPDDITLCFGINGDGGDTNDDDDDDDSDDDDGDSG